MAEYNQELERLTADIVAAYVANNSMDRGGIAELIHSVYGALAGVGNTEAVEPAAPVPAVPIKKSVTHEYLICLDDGKKFKSLKRHLAQLGMTADEYRAKWGLPADYPMVAPAYAEKRSALAKASGLGQARRKAPEPEPEPPKRRGRKPAAAA